MDFTTFILNFKHTYCTYVQTQIASGPTVCLSTLAWQTTYKMYIIMQYTRVVWNSTSIPVQSGAFTNHQLL